MQIDGRPVGPAALAVALDRVQEAARAVEASLGEGPTQFEALTAAAFLVLAEGGVEACVVEAGLGGRHDATRVINARVVGLTNVGLDHQRVLGDTRELILAEKLAVLEPRRSALRRRRGRRALRGRSRTGRGRRARAASASPRGRGTACRCPPPTCATTPPSRCVSPSCCWRRARWTARRPRLRSPERCRPAASS